MPATPATDYPDIWAFLNTVIAGLDPAIHADPQDMSRGCRLSRAGMTKSAIRVIRVLWLSVDGQAGFRVNSAALAWDGTA